LKVPGPRHRITRIAANLDGQLTHDGVASERSDLCDLRPAVMVGRDSVMADVSAITAPNGGSRRSRRSQRGH
jgi:hypothetical protein